MLRVYLKRRFSEEKRSQEETLGFAGEEKNPDLGSKA